MNELINLMEAGFTERQALAILNAAHPKSNADLVDLLPFHSWLRIRLKQRHEAKKRGNRKHD